MPLRDVIDPQASSIDYLLLDVFTGTPFQGNPLAVFPDAGALSARVMQQMARELNLSESVFMTATAMPGVFDVRIFTPHQELPFAGHPTIGAAWLSAPGPLSIEPSALSRSKAGQDITAIHVGGTAVVIGEGRLRL